MTFLMGVEFVFCVGIIFGSLDYLRAVMFWDKPMESASFLLLACGAFGLLIDIIDGYSPNFWGVMSHAGVILFALSRLPELRRHYQGSHA